MRRKIDSLEVDENLKNQLMKLMINSSSEEDSNYSSSSEDEINEGISSSAEEQIRSGKECQCNIVQYNKDYWKSLVGMKSLNVLTNSQEEILTIIDQVTDHNVKRQLLEFLIEKNPSNRESSKLILPNKGYQFQEVMNRFNHSRIKEKPASLQDLKYEINQLKIEISMLKHENKEFKVRISSLENAKKETQISFPETQEPNDLPEYLNKIHEICLVPTIFIKYS